MKAVVFLKPTITGSFHPLTTIKKGRDFIKDIKDIIEITNRGTVNIINGT